MTGLAVAKALGRRRIRIVGVSSTKRAAGARSRYLHFAQLPNVEEETELLRFYLELGRKIGGRPVLIPTGDKNVRFIAHNRDALFEVYRFFVWDRDQLEALASKRRFVALAERERLPLPATLLPANREELIDSIDGLRFPCVIKPEFTHLWHSPKATTAGIEGLKAIPVDDRDSLLRAYDRLFDVDPRVVVQQMVVGPDQNHESYQAFIDPEGRTRAELIGRKLRLAPAHYGMGSYVVSVHSDEVLHCGREVLRKLGYRGVGGVQFKRDSRDGKLYLLEMGIRCNVYTGLSVACGVDFPYYYYQASLGEPFDAPSDYEDGVHWMNPVDDFRSMRVYSRDGTRSWAGWLSDVLRFPVNAYFSWDDPMPWVFAMSRLAGGAARKLLRLPPES